MWNVAKPLEVECRQPIRLLPDTRSFGFLTLSLDCTWRQGLSVQSTVLAFLQLFKFSPRCLFWLGVGSQEGDTTPVISGQFIRDCRVCSSLTSTSRAATPLCWDLGIVINMKKSDLELYSMAQYLRMLMNIMKESVFLMDS